MMAGLAIDEPLTLKRLSLGLIINDIQDPLCGFGAELAVFFWAECN